MATNGCLDPAQMMQSLLANTITETEFNTWVANYFNNTPIIPGPKEYTVSEMKSITQFGNANCGICIKVRTDDPNTGVDNSDIVVTSAPVGPILSDSVDPITRYYDITLFNAIFTILDPNMPITGFGFTKANKTATGKQGATLDIIFSVTSTNGNTTYWDLSTTVPPPPNK